MGFGTKNRQKQTADICKQYLREKYWDRLELVEEFIVEIEGAPKNGDVTRWGQFTDIKDIKKEMLKRLEAHFEKGLPGGERGSRLYKTQKKLVSSCSIAKAGR
jgi:hypothetical protein